MRSLTYLASSCLLVACAGDPSAVQIELSPSVISSLDGTTSVGVLVSDAATPLGDEPVHVTVIYVDRNGTPHEVAPVDGTTDSRGVFRTTLTGLAWDGTGTVTAETTGGVTNRATFAVLDRTPPKIEILPPTSDKRVGPGLPLDVQVRVTDEIGVSEVTIDGTGRIDGSRSTVVANGTQSATLTFRMEVRVDALPGPTIQLHAIAADLSGNLAAATAVVLTVDPTITIATPMGLAGSLFVDGSATQLDDPRAIAVSARDGQLYVADNSQNGACSGRCIWRINPATGAITATPVFVGQGELEGIAFDATGDNLYYSDRQDRTGRLTWNGTAYASPVLCNDANAQRPQDPFHLVFDASLGLLVADDGRRQLARIATCATASVGTGFTATDSFDSPRGVALGPSGELYVSDIGTGRVSQVARTNGALSVFASGLDDPYGIEWNVGTTMPWANRLMVALRGARIVLSTTATTELAAAYLRNDPIDLAISGTTMYVLTAPSANNRGRIYKITGF